MALGAFGNDEPCTKDVDGRGGCTCDLCNDEDRDLKRDAAREAGQR